MSTLNAGTLNITGTLQLPSYNNSQRDALTPTIGMMIYNNEDPSVQVWDGEAWQVSVGTGGIAEPGQAYYSSPGSYTFDVPSGVTQISAVCVGGGGGGGGNNGTSGPGSSGGGGGGLAYGTFSVTSGESLTVTVGGGGSGGSPSSTGAAASGGDSKISRGGTDLLRGGGGNGGVSNTSSQIDGGTGGG